MKLSTRVRYGSRAMVELADSYPGESLSVTEIAHNQHLSVKYLEKIMSSLKTAGLVRADSVHCGEIERRRNATKINVPLVIYSDLGQILFFGTAKISTVK